MYSPQSRRVALRLRKGLSVHSFSAPPQRDAAALR